MRSKLMCTSSVAALVLASGLAISTYSTEALADGHNVKWGGAYLGVHLGAGQANWDGVFDCGPTPGPVTCTNNTSSAVFADHLQTDGILGGFHGGFNWQTGSLVVGIEGNFSFMDWVDREDANSSETEAIVAQFDSLASVRARIGMVSGNRDQLLLFLSAGVAWADAGAELCTDSSCNDDSVDFDEAMAVVGAGFEYAMTDNFRLRVDGSYYMFDDKKDLDPLQSGRSGDFLEIEEAYTVRIGGSWYFNQSRHVEPMK